MEVDGVDYNFWTREQFEKGIQDGIFLEWAEYNGNYYGTPDDQVKTDRTTILEIELRGARQVKKKCSNAILIMVWPPSIAVLEAQLRGRNDTSDEAIRGRLKEAEIEMREGPADMDYLILNKSGDIGLSRAIGVLRHILEAA